jgi:hypothetical protein
MPKLNLESKADWASIREDYLTDTPTPTYSELAERYGVSTSLVSRMAREEDWPNLRLKKQAVALQQIKAGEIIAQAVTASSLAIKRAEKVALDLFAALEDTIGSIRGIVNDEKSARKAFDMLNTASFAFSNTCQGLKTLGVVGLPKELANAGKSANNQWDKGLLQQINVTIGSLTGQAQVTAQDTAQSRSETTDTEQSGKEGGQTTALPAEQPAIDVPSSAAHDAQPARLASQDDASNSSG